MVISLNLDKQRFPYLNVAGESSTEDIEQQPSMVKWPSEIVAEQTSKASEKSLP